MSAATVVTFRNQVRWADLLWLTLRQHRAMLLSTGVLVLVGAVMMILVAVLASTRGTTEVSFLMIDGLYGVASSLAACLMAYSGVIAAFWSAPLLSREYEQRTHLLSWSQDVSAGRWLASKTTVLISIAIAFAVLLGALGNLMMREVNAVSGDQALGAFGSPFFEAAPLVQVGYVLFGFALGLATSAITRRTVVSIGLTAGIFFAVRLILAAAARPYYQTPERVTGPLGAQEPIFDWSRQHLSVDSGRLDAMGNEVAYTFTCGGGGQQEYLACMREHGVVERFVDYQPIDRLPAFHLIEFGICTGLAAGLLALTWAVTRKTTRL